MRGAARDRAAAVRESILNTLAQDSTCQRRWRRKRRARASQNRCHATHCDSSPQSTPSALLQFRSPPRRASRAARRLLTTHKQAVRMPVLCSHSAATSARHAPPARRAPGRANGGESDTRAAAACRPLDTVRGTPRCPRGAWHPPAAPASPLPLPACSASGVDRRGSSGVYRRGARKTNIRFFPKNKNLSSAHELEAHGNVDGVRNAPGGGVGAEHGDRGGLRCGAAAAGRSGIPCGRARASRW